MTNHINIDNPVIAFADNTPSSTEAAKQTTPIKHLLPQGMSRASQLIPFLPFGSSTLWAWSRDGRFPGPGRRAPPMTAWRSVDVSEWLESYPSITSEEV